MNRTPIKWLLLKKKRNVYPGSLRQNQMFRPSVDDLKQRISNDITTIDEAMLQRTWQEIEYRLDVLRATNGAHIEVY